MTYKKLCNCSVCDKPVEIEQLIPIADDDCIGVVCDDCYDQQLPDLFNFQITCSYELNKSGYTTKHNDARTIEAQSAVQAVTKYLDDLANAYDAVIMSLDIKVIGQ